VAKKEGSFSLVGGWQPGAGYAPAGAHRATRQTADRFFRSKFMTARSTKSPKDGQQLFEQVIFTTEKNLARRLGNSERIEKWQNVGFFKAARREWLNAWKRFATSKGFGRGSLFEIREGVQQTLEPEKAFTLASLRLSNRADEILRNRATVIGLSKDDPQFLKKIRLAQRSGRRRKGEGGFTSYSILCYWFAGLLWLMSDETGFLAFRQYTGKRVTIDAYRQARYRLGLKGYRGRVKTPPVVAYHPKNKRYQYGSSWTKLEQ
jgi:hypothetical protein